VPGLNLSDAVWDQDINSLLTFEGRTFGTFGRLLSTFESSWVLYFNENIIDELQLTCPHELVRRGEWTWEKFYEYQMAARKDLTGTGVWDREQRYGLSAPNSDFVFSFFRSAGNSLLGRDSVTGRFYYSLDNAQAYEAINEIRKMTTFGYTSWPKTPAEPNEAFTTAFLEGKSLFFGDVMMNIAELQNMRDDWGILPFPLGQGATEFHNGANRQTPIIGVPITNKDLDKTGIILNALAHSSEAIRQAERDDLEILYLRNRGSLETLDIFAGWSGTESMYLGRSLVPAVGQGTAAVVRSLVNSMPDTDPAAHIAATKDATLIAINDLEERIARILRDLDEQDN
jgi:hypothetical protein